MENSLKSLIELKTFHMYEVDIFLLKILSFKYRKFEEGRNFLFSKLQPIILNNYHHLFSSPTEQGLLIFLLIKGDFYFFLTLYFEHLCSLVFTLSSFFN